MSSVRTGRTRKRKAAKRGAASQQEAEIVSVKGASTGDDDSGTHHEPSETVIETVDDDTEDCNGEDTEDCTDDTQPARGSGRVYLKVPYQEKEEAKSRFNCQWDPDVAHWYVLDDDSEAALRQFRPATIAQIRDGQKQTLQKRMRREASSMILANATTPPRTPPKPRPGPGRRSIGLDDVKTFLKRASVEEVLSAFKLIKQRRQEILALLAEEVGALSGDDE